MSPPATAPFRSFLDLPRKLAWALAPPPASASWAFLRNVRARAWLYALVVFVCLGYAWLASAGGLDNWPTYGWFHDHQADGFRQGTTSMAIEPAPELLRAKNPFDPANSRYWVLDASYHDGKYYAYWGPVPALLQAAAKTVLGIHRTIGDQYVQFFHLCLGVWCGALLIERIARQMIGAISKPLVALGVLVFAAANPTLHTVASPSTYHTAIAAAQTWLVAGLLVAFDAVWLAGTRVPLTGRLVLTGTLWALALASRVTVAPAIAVFIAASAGSIALAKRDRPMLCLATSSVLLSLPVALAGVSLLIYNKVRFGSYLEFGTNVMFSAFPPFRPSKEFLLPNLYSYVFRPFETSCRFPYFFQAWRPGAEAFPEGMTIPPEYMVLEPVVGWFWAVPLTWLVPFAFLLAPRPLGANTRRTRVYVWSLVSFSALPMLAGLVGMGVYGATMRYLGDVTNGLVLLALVGGYALRARRFGKQAQRLISLTIVTLGTATILFGCALGYHGYNAHVERFNPELDAKLVRALSVCGDTPPASLRYMH